MKSISLLSRILALILAVCLVMTHASDAEAKKRKRYGKRQTISRSAGVNDPRYAAIIMNPVTGEIYHQRNADARRYPASLTKMMTLYLLFEALEQKKISLDGRMYVSDLASRQPQTNLALDPGDQIDVETAIKALVVRSANDVAIVVAEALGGDVESFAEQMTAKARALGMKSTTFRNPNGLPVSGQVTSARDMAKLGIALKRDFPTYYRYFSTLQFSHAGVTYYTHNRVMLRYAGVDGIKTGYIGTSGFNLVTSVVRGGRPLVGAVMGGGSGRWRDDRMIQLLDESYKVVASRGASRGKMFAANLPLPKAGGKQGVGIADTGPIGAPTPELRVANIPESDDDEEGGETGAEDTALPPLPPVNKVTQANANSPFDVVQAVTATKVPEKAVEKVEKPAAPPPPPAKSTAPVKPKEPPPKPEPKPAKAKPEPKPTEKKKEAPAVPKKPELPPLPPIKKPQAPTAPAKPEAVASNKAKDAAADTGWGIQVGAFSSQELAQQAVTSAQKTAARRLVGAKSSVLGPKDGKKGMYKARLDSISQTQAKNACEDLIKANSPCFIYKTSP